MASLHVVPCGCIRVDWQKKVMGFQMTHHILSSAADTMSAAHKAFSFLRYTSHAERIRSLGKVRENIVRMRSEITDTLVKECGKTRTDANIEIIGVLDWIKWLQDHSSRFLQDQKVPTPITLMGKKSRIYHEPLGPVLIIAPWNYPFHIGITQIFTAFICGNPVLYKPSEITPMKGLYEKVLSADSLIAESVQICYGDGQLGRDLIDQQPEKIFFTGSTRTGKAISRQAADYLIPVDLELGGKDPMLVFSGANIKRAVSAAVWGAFTHNGQSCSAVERLYVQEDILQEFTEELILQTKALKQRPVDELGDTDLSRITVRFQYDIVLDHINDAVTKGARILTGGNVIDEQQLMVEPTVLDNVTSDMKAVSEETFGPVLPLMSFKTENDAIRLANDSGFGLQASVFTADPAQGTRVARQLEVGGVSVNNVNMVEGNPWLSFGGRKQTGTGRTRGVEGLMAFTRSKHILIDPDSGKTEANWYPYTRKKYGLVVGFLKALFVESPFRLAKAAITGLALERESGKPRR